MDTHEPRIDLLKLAGLLSKAIGEEKAEAVVRDTARKLGLGSYTDFSQRQALEILESIASTPGIVGVTARFAKSRLHLASR